MVLNYLVFGTLLQPPWSLSTDAIAEDQVKDEVAQTRMEMAVKQRNGS